MLSLSILPFVKPDCRVTAYRAVEIIYSAFSRRVIFSDNSGSKYFCCKFRADALCDFIASHTAFKGLDATIRKCNVYHNLSIFYFLPITRKHKVAKL